MLGLGSVGQGHGDLGPRISTIQPCYALSVQIQGNEQASRAVGEVVARGESEPEP